MFLRILILLGVCIALFLGSTWVSYSAPSTQLEPVTITLAAADLQQAAQERTVITPDGVSTDSPTAELLTDPYQVARFSDIMVAWDADMLDHHDVQIFVRTSLDQQTWSDWGEIIASDDLRSESDPLTLYWGSPLFAGQANWWQIKVILNGDHAHKAPTLRSLEVHTVDVGAWAPVTPEPARPDTTTTVAKPPVVSRTQWGSEDGQGSRVPPAYYPVSHLVVHHTVDPNTLTSNESWWGDRVRAIWVFHTYSRGWGDIGYNYLVAPDGTIFEGRAGGDNGVGFHDTGNYGSMGVAMVGTYSSTAPSNAAQDSVVELLAWKASQRGIDPLGSSYYYGCDISRYCGNSGAWTPNIAGHRNVANNPQGYTSCPGDTLFNVLPTLRSRVQSRLSGLSDNGDLTIDNLESSFIRSNAQWYESACGDGGHVYYTYATNNPDESTNTGRWRKTGLEAGDYRIYVHIPQNCTFTNRTQQAKYTIWQNGVKVGESIVDQNTSTEWIEITAGPVALSDLPVEVHLKDLTGESLADERVIIFDTVRWVREVPQTSITLEDVRYDRTSLASGELLKVEFVVRNTGNTTIQTQLPESGDLNDPFRGYTYDEGECFAGNSSQTYPAFPKESGRMRVMLGSDDITLDCVAGTGGYPWRWGLGSELQPNEQRTLVGFVRFRNPTTSNRTVTLRAGLIHEYVQYIEQDIATQTITITPEKDHPQSNSYSSAWQPEAFVYELGTIPDDFLARTKNPLSIPEGSYLGAFEWDGRYIDWGDSGPFGRSDGFIVRQTRTFYAPTEGLYRFRLRSDDGAWLWIDGLLVTEAHGLHPEREAIGEAWLTAGKHVIAFKYFERSAQAVMSYDWQPPNSLNWSVIPVDVAGQGRYANGYFSPNSEITISADDHGGTGVRAIRWQLGTGSWNETIGERMTINAGSSNFILNYYAVDRADNSESQRSMTIAVDATPPTSTIPQASVTEAGVIRLNVSATDQQSGVSTIVILVRDETTQGPWKIWQLVNSPRTVSFFGINGHTYAFKTQARDAVGNIEQAHNVNDAVQTVPLNATMTRQYLPTVRR